MPERTLQKLLVSFISVFRMRYISIKAAKKTIFRQNPRLYKIATVLLKMIRVSRSLVGPSTINKSAEPYKSISILSRKCIRPMCEIVFLAGDWAHPFSSIRSNLESFSYANAAECSLLGARRRPGRASVQRPWFASLNASDQCVKSHNAPKSQ